LSVHHIVLWKWNQPGFREAYTAEHVNEMIRMLKQHLNLPHRVICVTDDPVGVKCETFPLWDDFKDMKNPNGAHLPSCFRRLKLFDTETQAALGIRKGERIVSLDLDALIVNRCDEVFGRKDRWVGWAVRGTYHPRVFNGSLWMFTAGDLENMWTGFDPKISPAHVLRNGFYGSDQAWLSYKLAREPFTMGWTWPHVVSYPREVRIQRCLDKRTMIIFFHGAAKPWHPHVQRESPWLNRFMRKAEKAKEEAAT
jgi:hypothetical protein